MIREYTLVSSTMGSEIDIVEGTDFSTKVLNIDVLAASDSMTLDEEKIKYFLPSTELLKTKLEVKTDDYESEFRQTIANALYGIMEYYKTRDGLQDIVEDMMYDNHLDTIYLGEEMFYLQAKTYQKDNIMDIQYMIRTVLDCSVDTSLSYSQMYFINDVIHREGGPRGYLSSKSIINSVKNSRRQESVLNKVFRLVSEKAFVKRVKHMYLYTKCQE